MLFRINYYFHQELYAIAYNENNSSCSVYL